MNSAHSSRLPESRTTRAARSLTLALAALVFLPQCARLAAGTRFEYLESDHGANFERIFEKPAPEGVSIVNSVVIRYEWRLGVVTTDDWEIELLAPRKWVEELREELHLAPVDRDWPEGPYSAAGRKQDPFRPWYAPRPLEDYEPYWLQLTSIPYRHMLVQREPEPDGRVRVFVSKH